MNVREAIRSSLGLLSERDRWKYRIVVLLQMSTAFLDLLGVVLLGLVVALASSAATGQPVPTTVSRITEILPSASLSPVAQAGWLAVIAGLLLISKSVLNVLFSLRILRFLANRQAAVSGALAKTFLESPLLFVQRRPSQQVSYALTVGANAATLTILTSASALFTEAALLGVLAVGLLLLDPWVTIATVAFFALVGVVLQRSMSSWASSLGTRNSETEIASAVVVQEAMRSYREISVSNRRRFYVSKFQCLRSRAASLQAELGFIQVAPKYVFEIALVVGTGLLAASQLLTKDLTGALASITITLVAATRIIPSILRLQQGLLNVRWAAGAAQATFELDGELKEAVPLGQSMSNDELSLDEVARSMTQGHTGFRGEVVLRGVSFRYPSTDEYSISDVSVSVSPGSSLALVGSTGAGKSTLTDLILGLLSPDDGSVLIDGHPPVAAIDRWPGAIAYVPQEVAMVDGSVRENVAIGIPQDLIDDDRVLEALRRAHLDQFLIASREGLDTVVGEHGVRLSGGQRQRLGIARALYSRPRLLVLDEATSALDAETERAVIQTLNELSGHVTAITIAHRLATVQHCDQVAFLEAGRIVSVGTFSEVRERVPSLDQQATLLGL